MSHGDGNVALHIIQENLEYAGSVFNGNQQYLVIPATPIGQLLAP